MVQFFDWESSDPTRYGGLNGLTDELMTYKNNLRNLLRNEGKIALIRGLEVIGVYETREEAIAVAHERFPGQKVLIKQIVAKEPVHTTGGVGR